MKDSLNQVTVGQFKTSLILSEIIITAIVLYGFFLIFNRFNKKNTEFKKKSN